MRFVVVSLIALVGITPLISESLRQVEYDIDGTAKYADVTWINRSGGTEQKRLMLPVHESLLLAVGKLAYVSAQKANVYNDSTRWNNGSQDPNADGVHGSVHVSIRINGRLVGEATSTAPYGTAKSSVPVE